MDWAGSAACTLVARLDRRVHRRYRSGRSRKSGPWSTPIRRSRSDPERRDEMAHWLMKTEPGTFSWDDQVERGAKGEPWSGVRNHQAQAQPDENEKGRARVFLSLRRGQGDRRHRRGDSRALSRLRPPNPASRGSRSTSRRSAPFNKPVTLVEAKTVPGLKDMVLVNNTRLSVQPVTADEWDLICKMGGVKSAEGSFRRQNPRSARRPQPISVHAGPWSERRAASRRTAPARRPRKH